MSLIIRILLICTFSGFSMIPKDGLIGTNRAVHSEDNLKALNWADSVYQSLTQEERIGQLMMLRAYSNQGKEHTDQINLLIEKHHIGSLCFFQGTPQKQVALSNAYQKRSKIPLLIAIDAEWGLGMRHKEAAMSFPHQLMLGAIQDDKLIYQMGREVGRQLRRIGVHINFAPVVDVNNNKQNPVINDRSFGENVENVSSKSRLYMLGMQEEGILACAKHFPGHGDTDVDSHLDLPVIPHDMNRLDSIELMPFQRMIGSGVKSIMVAHLNIPALESDPKIPTTLSANTVTKLLKDKMGFGGLVITDAMDMKGVTKHFEPGEAEALAVAAGNDILCLPRDVPKAVSVIKRFISEGKITESRLRESVTKILMAKYQAGLHLKDQVDSEALNEDLFTPEAHKLTRQLERSALTLVRNEDKNLPLRLDDPEQIAVLDIGTMHPSAFQKRMSSYGINALHRFNKGNGSTNLLENLAKKETVIVAFHDLSRYPRNNFGLHKPDIDWVRQLAAKTRVVTVLFGNPYILSDFEDFRNIIMSYEDSESIQDQTAQAIIGANSFVGKLPITASPKSVFGAGIRTASLFKFGYALPEEVGLSSVRLLKVDSLIEEIIKERATPGCQLLIAKDGKIVHHKAYGHHTYKKQRAVQLNDVYDLASLTKVLASTMSIMDLFNQNRISVFRKLSDYIPEIKGTNKEHLIIENVLTHNARLVPWIPFYKETLNDQNKPDPKWYNRQKDDTYSLAVAKGLYIHKNYRDSIWQKIIDSDLRNRRGYRYSDLGFYIADKLIQKTSGLDVAEYSRINIFEPLGLRNTFYNPYQRIDLDRIVPTEVDKYFRHQTLKGYVHDMGAAMLGGISGHAGLFSNTYEVGILMQSLLNGGYYGGERLFHPVTVALFTARPETETRRGLGFDMKQLDPSKSLNMSELASYRTFGHLGFTGTCAWADPTHNLVFVFLSNRTYPNMENNKLGKENYRPKLQTLVYEALL